MFHHLLHLLICVNVLVCPAMGGQCCSSTDDLGHVAVSVSGCCDCCCADDAEHAEQKAPLSPPCSDRCHDCFCAGALPPAFETPMPQLDSTAIVAFVVVSMDAPLSACADRGLAYGSELGVGFRPPSGRALLTFYCTLLL